jgi:hypothetical protein
MSLTEDDKQWLTDRFKELETKLLTAFEQWANRTGFALSPDESDRLPRPDRGP